ncbi:CPBP family intramembrane metalloprotease [Clostridium chromiireducens]|uniref:CPBP family intramembrane metalloprotease n=1 Tax=Clostridium chromiireducens TaxID=225345 RepID=A0A399IHI8_9CLOT|nr:CPBP family intramembrane glutamic endopeptidase [Clostridium chromiireducens]RII32448.1 CPBP family intramembrane metalloprotease [Clostridium chromiireducens]
MKFDSDFNEVKIRNVVVIYLITIVTLIIASFFILSSADGEISNSDMNKLCMQSGIILFSMLIYKVKPSKEKIINLYNDFKIKLNVKEIICIISFFTCLNVGGSKLIIDLLYLIDPSFANDFINDIPFTINSTTDYWMCFIIVVILSPVIDELTFRYVLFKRISKKLNIYAGLIVSSIIFSAINLCPEMIGNLALGVINCILYIKYENILMPMLICTINGLLYMLVVIPFQGFKTEYVTLTSDYIIMNAISGTVLFSIGIIFFIRFITKNKICLRESFDKDINLRI